MSWIYLTIAIFAEIIATSALKSATGFTRLWPSLITAGGYAIAFFFLSLSLRTIPVGIAYAVWSGVGIVAIALIRSEEHTSELQSRFDLVCRLLLEKKKIR